jgi:hypothetical protein
MEVTSGISVKKRFNNTFLRNHLKKIFKMQSGVINPGHRIQLKMEKARFSETLASSYEATLRQNLRQHQHHTNRHVNLKFHLSMIAI